MFLCKEKVFDKESFNQLMKERDSGQKELEVDMVDKR